MTKEELEKEAEKYFKSICEDYNEEYERTGKRHYWVGFDIKKAYLAGAEPREKQITGLSKHILELQKDKGNLTDRVRELEQEIEKMKKYLDCDCCEYQNDKDECHQCNFMTKTKWTLKKEIKEK